ncbi:MAG TPA: hypothetical protein VLD67_02030 [Vicinamibacterales bacterium]|nr:hypothetical protein [Vicinamibacterales bacterium]
MTPKRAALYLLSVSLLVAWLASAASVSWQAPDPPTPRQPVPTAGTETLAAEVQAQTVRLKERLASAPAPQQPLRNPFAFAPRAPAPQREAVPPQALAASAPLLPPEPPLTLIGVAEHQRPDGPVRTAILSSTGEDLFMVAAGQTLGARYDVTAVGSDFVVLTDRVTGGVRRLALR